MKTSKKILSLFLALLMMLSLLPTAAFADGDPVDHVHSFAEAWTFNETAHWHACTAESCGIEDYAACGIPEAAYGVHDFANGDCVCGAKAPVATSEAKIGDTEYATLADAVAAAQADDIVEIVESGTYTLPNIPKNITIKAAADVAVTIDATGSGSICSIPNGVTFENLTMNFGQTDYHGFQHAGTINMNNCTLNGLFFSYGVMNFSGCTFNQSAVEYNMWCYGKDITYTNCVFNSLGKFLNLYNEGNGGWNISVVGCTFNNLGAKKKAPLNAKDWCCNNTQLSYFVSVTGCTVNNTELFPAAGETWDNGDGTTGLALSPIVQVDDVKKEIAAGEKHGITVALDGKVVYENGAKVETSPAPAATAVKVEEVVANEDNNITAEMAEEINNNTAIKEEGATNAAEVEGVASLYIGQPVATTKGAEQVTVTKVMFEVELKDENGEKIEEAPAIPVNFRLPVVVEANKVAVYHGDELIGYADVQGSDKNRYIDVTGTEFSPYGYEILSGETENPVAAIGTVGYATLVAAFEAAKTGDTITVLQNCSFTYLLVKDKIITLDLNGMTITALNGGSAIGLEGNATLNATDGSTGETGTVIGKPLAFWIEGESNTLNILGGTYIDNGSNMGVVNCNGYDNNTVNISGGMLKSTEGSTPAVQLVGKGNRVNITGGTIDAKTAVTLYGVNNAEIEGGKFVNTTTIIRITGTDGDSEVNNVEIKGGSFPETVTAFADIAGEEGSKAGKVEVSGGKFGNEVPAEFCKEGYEPVQDPNTGEYIVEEVVLVASVKISETITNYTDLSKAFEAACKVNGAVVTLLDDVDLAGINWAPVNFAGIFDGANHKISNLTVTGNSGVEGFFSYAAGTVKDVTFENAKVIGSNYAAVVAAVAGNANGNYPTLTLDNVDIKNSEVTGSQKCGGLVGHAPGIQNQKGCTLITVTNCDINDLQFKGTDADGIWQSGAIIGYVQPEQSVTAYNNNVKGITIDDAYEKYSGTNRQYASNAFIGTISNKLRPAYNDSYDRYVIDIHDNTVEPASGARVDEDTSTEFFGGYFNWFEEEGVEPTKIVLNGIEITKKPVAMIGDVYYTSLASAVEAAQAGDIVTLLDDVTLSGMITIDKNITLDGNDKTITLSDNFPKLDAIRLTTTTGATIQNVKFENLDVLSDQMAAIGIRGGGTADDHLVIGNCIFKGADAVADAGNAMGICSTGTAGGYIDVTNSTFTNLKYAMYFNKVNDLTVSGNMITGTKYNAINVAADRDGRECSNISITGNNMTDLCAAAYYSDEYSSGVRIGEKAANVAMSENTVMAGEGKKAVFVSKGGEVAISSGTFSSAIPEEYCAEGYIPTMNADGTYGVKEGAYVASVTATSGTVTKYETLADAVAAAKDGDTVTLLADVTGGSGIQIAQGVFGTNGLTIDFNNHTYTAIGPAVGSSGTKNQVFQILKGNKITMKNGMVNVAEGKAEEFKFVIQNYSDLTLDGVTLDGSNLGKATTNYVLSNNNGNTVLKNGTTITAKTDDVAFDVYDYASGGYAGVSVTIGSSDVVINGAIEFGGDRTGGNHAELTKPAGYTLTAPAGYVWYKTDGVEKLVTELEAAKLDAIAKINAMAGKSPSDEMKQIVDKYIGENGSITKAESIEVVNTELANAIAEIEEQYKKECVYEETLSIIGEHGSGTLYLNNKKLGQVTLTATTGGYSIKLDSANKYLKYENGKVVKSNSPFTWRYNGTGFCVTESTAAGKGILVRLIDMIVSLIRTDGHWFESYTTYYLASESTVSTLPVKAELRNTTTGGHVMKYVDNRDGKTHTRACSNTSCEFSYVEEHEFGEDHKCVQCGAMDPKFVSVEAKVVKSSSRILFITNYTYMINPTVSGTDLKKVEYSLDGGFIWFSGSSFTIPSNNFNFKFRITCNDRSVTYFNVKNGTNVTKVE